MPTKTWTYSGWDDIEAHGQAAGGDGDLDNFPGYPETDTNFNNQNFNPNGAFPRGGLGMGDYSSPDGLKHACRTCICPVIGINEALKFWERPNTATGPIPNGGNKVMPTTDEEKCKYLNMRNFVAQHVSAAELAAYEDRFPVLKLSNLTLSPGYVCEPEPNGCPDPLPTPPAPPTP